MVAIGSLRRIIDEVIGYRLPGGAPRVGREDQLLWQGGWAAIGLFDARPDDPHFRSSGPPGEHLFVFPCTSVSIERDGETPFVADRTTATFYEPDQIYTRAPVSPRGDRGHWFSLAPGALEEVLGAAGLRGRGERLLPFAVGSVDLATYARQSGLVRRLRRGEAIDDLALEEAVLSLAEKAVRGAGGTRAQSAGPCAGQVALAVRARRLLAERWMEPIRLAELAAALDCPAYHLSRVFRRVTGSTLHGHREQLRLRRALLEIPRRRGDLAGLALDLGYSSHSHFTAAFRRALGTPPTGWLQGLDGGTSHR